jgi:Protein of unknown function (DUF1367)
MLEIMMTKHGNVLMPYSAVGVDEFDALPSGSTVKVQITQPRNIRHHNMWFALLQATFDAQDYFKTLDELHDEIKIAMGYFVTYRRLDGSIYPHPKSIAFSKMDNLAFRIFFDRAVELIINRILPLCSQDDLEERIYTILGEPRPSDIQRHANKGEPHVQAT